jgi:t-SNARE complex subunit (syntaxin)
MNGNKASLYSYNKLRTGEYDDDWSLERKMRDQDENLDSLGKSVTRLGELSFTISKEIDTQSRILSNLELEVDDAQANTESLMSKTNEFLNKSAEKNFWCVAIFLVVLLFILTALVLYT